jgi:hypothetical protein
MPGWYTQIPEGSVRQKYLGDSYDIVKRFWAESLHLIAPLYAHPRFVPNKIYAEYTRLTTIPILPASPTAPFGILLDPDTGIPRPTGPTERVTVKHAPLSFIADIDKECGPAYLICFDQSRKRCNDLTWDRQREEKMTYLRDRGLSSFYYVSHASFLFASRGPDVIRAIRAKLSSLGVPPDRLQPDDGQ